MAASALANSAPPVRYGRIIFLIAFTQLIVTSDFLMISVTLPSIGRDFAVPPNLLSWVIAANALTFAGFMTVGGRLGDLFGRRSCFLAGTGLFALASLGSAASAGLDMLIAMRALQGIGTALLAPANFSLLNTLLPEGAVRNRAFGIFGMVQGGSLFLGLLLGGMLTTALGWRAVFVLNIPLIAVIAWLAWRVVPPVAARATGRSIDLPGAILVVIATALLIRSLSAMAEFGWASPRGLGFVASGLAAFGVFFLVESRVRDPLLPLAVFRYPNVVGANIVTLCTVAGAGGLFVVLSIYLQRVLGYSAMMSGLGLMPYAVGILLGGHLSSRGMDRWPLRVNMLTGTAVSSVSLLLFQMLSRERGYAANFPMAEILVATGTIFGLVASQAAATRAIPPDRQGVGSALQLMAQQIGTALGTSLALSVMASAVGRGGDTPYRAALLVSSGLVGAAFLAALLLTRSRSSA